MDKVRRQMEEGRSVFKMLTGKSMGKKSLGKPRLRIDLKEIGVSRRFWIDSSENRDYWRDLVNAALNFRVS